MDTRYGGIEAIQVPIAAERQGARRHYGVHPYFTRRPFNVVRKYLLHYSREGDLVVDPFGGSGVTAIEAWLENRHGVQNDINPLANFIAKGIVGLEDASVGKYADALLALHDRCKPELAKIEVLEGVRLQEYLHGLTLPPDVPLPRTADVETYHQLFTPKQLASLTILREAVEDIPSVAVRRGMLLAWSATLTKLNRTFLSADGRKDSRGGSSIFSIYRYKVAKKPVELPAWQTFKERALNVIAAKEEIERTIEAKRSTVGWKGQFTCHNHDIQELADRYERRADYIFTDPPYGGHISYLDLSTLWNVWLGLSPTKSARKSELIVGGELDLPEELYTRRLGESIEASLRMLKPGRWLSVVFQHWNVTYFESILASAGENGGDLRAAVSHVGDPIWSMHKKKGSESVLAGEMILTFFKTGKEHRLRRTTSFDVEEEVIKTLADTQSGKMFGEYLFNRIVLKAWRHGAISSLDIKRTELADMIRRQGWHYNAAQHAWTRGEEHLPLLSAAP